MEKKSKLVCRKCGGPHLTLRCGKPKKSKTDTIKDTKKRSKKSSKKNFKSNKKDRNYKRRDDHIKKTKVLFSNLPEDLTVREMNELLQEWGRIGRISTKYYQYSNTVSAFVDFYHKDEAEYLVKALDRTGFGHMIMQVKILD